MRSGASCSSRRYRRTAAAYGGAALLLNLLIFASSALVSFPLPDTQAMRSWRQFLGSSPQLFSALQLSSLLLPLVFIAVWSLPFYRKSALKELLDRRTVNMPLAFALAGTSGWILNCAAALFILFLFAAKSGLDVAPIACSTLFFSAFLSFFSFSAVYFLLEFLNRTFTLPRLFPDGRIASIRGCIILSVRRLFVMFYISACFFPVSILAFALLSIRQSRLVPEGNSLFILSVWLAAAGLCITLVFSRFFSAPLKRLQEGIRRVAEGDYSWRTGIASNDELGIVSDAFNSMSGSLEEKEGMRVMFGQYVSPEIRDYILAADGEFSGETVGVTVMFCDIRGFTQLSERMEPAAVVRLLNRYFQAMAGCIAENRGIINKYIGDAVMAVFGAPVKSSTHASDAYSAARSMRRALSRLNEEFCAEQLPELKFGIGLHTGPALAGCLGSEDRREYTVIGDTVNTASRIESLCKEYGCDILLSEATLRELPPSEANLKAAGSPCIRGKTQKLCLYYG